MSTSDRDFDFTQNGGEMGELIRGHDWSKSPLGYPSAWPQSLKTALSICLGSKFPMVIWWGKKFCVFYNDAYIPIAGPKHPFFIGAPAIEMWPEIWDIVGVLANHVVDSGEATFSEDQPLYMERKGIPEELYFTFSFSPARDESGAVGGMFCAVQEMTGRVVGERRLRMLRELGDQISVKESEVASNAARIMSQGPNEAPFGLIYLTDKDNKNATLAGSFGLQSGGESVPQKLNLENFSLNSWPLEDVYKNNKSLKIEGLRKKFGQELPKIPYEEMPDSAYIMPMTVAGKDEPAGFLICGLNPRLPFEESYQGFFELVVKQIVSQISNVRTIEEQKQRLQALAEIDQAKTAFFSNVSHEFRTPLTLILGPIEDLLAGGKGKLSSSQQAEVEVIHRNSLRLLKLVNALLDFSRIEAGRMQARFVPLDIVEFTTNIAGSFRSAIERAGLKYSVTSEPLPEPVYLDLDLWEKIVLNLLSNAYKYTLKGEIHLHLAQVGNSVELSVSDTGIGIPRDELGKVFQRFHRVEGVMGRTHEGTGIGLALVLELVKLHGGTTRVESSLGVGSKFFVTIPFGRGHLPQASVANPDKRSLPVRSKNTLIFEEEALRWDSITELGASSQVEDTSLVPLNGRKRIIIADDNSDMREYVSSLLRDRYEVKTVNDGAQALAAAKNLRPDLIISDIMMPVMDGIQFLRELRGTPAIKTIPVVLLSARAGAEEKISGIETGADDYLTKPFSAKELLARVGTQLQMAEIRQKAAISETILASMGRQQKWLESILDLVPNPLLLMDPENGRIDFANQSAHAMAGGKFPMDVPLEDYGTVYNITDERGNVIPISELPAARAARGEKLINQEIVWNTPSGQFTVLVDSQTVPGLEGAPGRVILCLRDISQLKLIESELKHSIGVRDQFLSLASHELNTPLTSLKLQTQMLKREFERGDPASFTKENLLKLVSKNETQIVRLAYLVDNMLDISRIETGSLNLDLQYLDMVHICKEVIEGLSAQAIYASSSISFDGGQEAIMGRWDRFKVEQIVTNLITNALKYGMSRPVHVAVKKVVGHVLIQVQDHGKGIPEEDQARIFKRFERATPSNEVSGLGLGLYIANEIAHSHGGAIIVESAYGEGSRFTVTLPLTPDC